MRLLRDEYTFSSNERWTLGAVLGGVLYVALVACAPRWAGQIPPFCFARWFGGYCPGCGLTRACACLLRLDVASALQYNLLAVLVAPFVAYRVLELMVGMASGRVLIAGWPRWFVAAYQWAFLGAWFVLGVIRAATWLFPQFNPGHIGLPPVC